MTVTEIVDGLNSSDAREQEEAEKALRDMGPDAVKPLIKLTGEHAPLEIILILAAVGTPIIVACRLIARQFPSLFSPQAALRFYNGFFIAYGAIFILQIIWKRCDRRFEQSQIIRKWWHNRFGDKKPSKTATRIALFQTRSKQARQILLDMDHLRCIVPVCETLSPESSAFNVPKLQEALLIKLLPKLNATDGAFLTPAARRKLYPYLVIDNALQYADFLIAILRALEQMGDETAIQPVRDLARSVATSPNGIRVRTEAQHCLAALRARVGRMEVGKTLLRASVEPGEVRDSLLRPATGNEVAEETLLLRSSIEAPEELKMENRS
jgi:hypothetical protein